MKTTIADKIKGFNGKCNKHFSTLEFAELYQIKSCKVVKDSDICFHVDIEFITFFFCECLYSYGIQICEVLQYLVFQFRGDHGYIFFANIGINAEKYK